MKTMVWNIGGTFMSFKENCPIPCFSLKSQYLSGAKPDKYLALTILYYGVEKSDRAKLRVLKCDILLSQSTEQKS